jgi:hypothetical protein
MSWRCPGAGITGARAGDVDNAEAGRLETHPARSGEGGTPAASDGVSVSRGNGAWLLIEELGAAAAAARLAGRTIKTAAVLAAAGPEVGKAELRLSTSGTRIALLLVPSTGAAIAGAVGVGTRPAGADESPRKAVCQTGGGLAGFAAWRDKGRTAAGATTATGTAPATAGRSGPAAAGAIDVGLRLAAARGSTASG